MRRGLDTALAHQGSYLTAAPKVPVTQVYLYMSQLAPRPLIV